MNATRLFTRINGCSVQKPFKANRHVSMAAGTSQRLYEYFVVIHDLPNSSRPSNEPAKLPCFQKLTLVGNILGQGRQDIRGDVLACQASSKEEVEIQLKGHPFAKHIWDMDSVSIWPLETIHTSPLDISQPELDASK